MNAILLGKRLFLAVAVIGAGSAAVTTAATAAPKARPGDGTTSCACTCRQESETEVHLANYTVIGVPKKCGMLNGESCTHTVKHRDGTSYTVSGKYEGCTGPDPVGAAASLATGGILVEPTPTTPAMPVKPFKKFGAARAP